MIITISGTPGSGKSTVAKLLAKKLRYAHHSEGEYARAMAAEMGITLEELNARAERDKSIDESIDRNTIETAERGKDIVIDARLAWHFIPDSVKILLTVSPEVAAQRIFAARRPDEQNLTLRQTKENVARRLRSEITRYAKRYQVDYTDPKHYDIVINTNSLTEEKIIDRIITFLRKTVPA